MKNFKIKISRVFNEPKLIKKDLLISLEDPKDLPGLMSSVG
jgi:hypothetical protein